MKPKITHELRQRIDSLKPGESFTVTIIGRNPGTYRNYAYAYIRSQGLKPYFRIYTEGTEGERLRFKRLETPSEHYGRAPQDSLGTAETFFMEHLIAIDSPEEARAIIDQAIESGTLNSDDLIPTVQEWERQNKKPESDEFTRAQLDALGGLKTPGGIR